MLSIYEREGWSKAELELEDQRREGEATERRLVEELGCPRAQGAPTSIVQACRPCALQAPPAGLLEELIVHRAQGAPTLSHQV